MVPRFVDASALLIVLCALTSQCAGWDEDPAGEAVSGTGRRLLTIFRHRSKGTPELDLALSPESYINNEIMSAATADQGGRRSRRRQNRNQNNAGKRRNVIQNVASLNRGYKAWQKKRFSDMNNLVIDTLQKLPLDDVSATALRVGSYFMNMMSRGVPQSAMVQLLTTRVGGPRDTISTLVTDSRNPELLVPVLEDIAANYGAVLSITGEELDTFLEAVIG